MKHPEGRAIRVRVPVHVVEVGPYASTGIACSDQPGTARDSRVMISEPVSGLIMLLVEYTNSTYYYDYVT